MPLESASTCDYRLGINVSNLPVELPARLKKDCCLGGTNLKRYAFGGSSSFLVLNFVHMWYGPAGSDFRIKLDESKGRHI